MKVMLRLCASITTTFTYIVAVGTVHLFKHRHVFVLSVLVSLARLCKTSHTIERRRFAPSCFSHAREYAGYGIYEACYFRPFRASVQRLENLRRS